MIARRSLFALPLLAAAPALAQERYPSRPIRFIVPFAAGAATDLRARIFAERMAQDWGQPVVVDNRGGANGFIAAEAVARARGDGYTLLFTSNTTHGSNPALFRRLPYDPIKDFEPVALLGVSTMLVVVNNNLGIRSIGDLIAYGRANPGKLSFGSGSQSSRMAGEMFKSMAGIDMENVSYRANPQAITDVISGTLPLMFCDTTTAIPQVREGRVRALAVTAGARISAMPDLPTVAEAGNLPGYELGTWTAVYATAGTPREIVDQLNAKLREILALPAVTERLRADATEPLTGSSDHLRDFTLAEIEKWTRVARQAGIQPE
ncbi:Bug family tripartite tricarboxylate transporter substrate binding protein [Falsiroseomonas stagni]|uniref:Tripartite-type tricarboxylate transporter, receptor component TctC n=1 Tax=Falsiroseomonas stagni DSM 19981 TaxID=1123062 RepID=A0A1I4C0W4_9PROT|nr:tripartite tricarboxylate transporter substrate binding protein [Falsiroseomonas stagni]SFK74575.1 Tripartite-type tricarboxylate transporter, receptor component TctC [Falsiroseomonas stagni DSM 19981]